MSDDLRLIKKYPNRRLYDTALSTYITLEDLKKYVINYEIFKVVDAKTNEDLTRPLLIQIILELEGEGKHIPLFSQEMLEQIVRFYGHPMQDAFQNFLAQSILLFAKQQANFQKNGADKQKSDPVAAMTELTAKNLAAWMSLWDKSK